MRPYFEEESGYFVDKSTAAYQRVSLGAFIIRERIHCEHQHPIIKEKMFQFNWKCVCGRLEAINLFHRDVEKYLNGPFIDVAKIIEDYGAISEEHLTTDGFTASEIKEIRRGYVSSEL